MAKNFLTPVALPAGSTAPTPSAGDNSTKLATTAYVDGALSGYVTTASYTAADVRAKLLTVDGASSGIDADLLDGQQGSYYLNASNINAGTLADARLPTTQVGKTFSSMVTAPAVVGSGGGTGFVVGHVTSDGSDNDRLILRGGGGTSNTRGAYLLLHGNEYASDPGLALLTSGLDSNLRLIAPGTGKITLEANVETSGTVKDSSGRTLGYRESIFVDMSGNLTLDDTHSGKTFYNNDGVSYTITIPTGLNAGMMFQVIAYGSGSSIVLSRNGTNLYWIKGDGTAPNANRTVGAFGWATVYTLNGTAWFITGVGIT